MQIHAGLGVFSISPDTYTYTYVPAQLCARKTSTKQPRLSQGYNKTRKPHQRPRTSTTMVPHSSPNIPTSISGTACTM
jgi:hypothetical protein